MNFALFFIDRPIFATVVSLLISLIGAIAYFSLPVTQYPEIAPPTIQVSASYPGASAETVANTVATPIEQEINGVEKMLYMTSQSTGDGRMSLNVVFRLGTDLDEAQVLVQNRVSVAEPRLPEEVRRLGVTTRKASPDLMMVIHMLSPDGSRDQLYISNYARTQVVDRLARIEGVGQATVFAERAYSMRIWLDPELVAAQGLTAGEVVAALRANNVQVASGVVNRLPVPEPGAFELQVVTQGRLTAPEEFAEIVVLETDDRLVRVRDIARVELGAQDYSINGYLGRDNALPIGIFQRPGSNALETAEAIIAAMDEMAEEFPTGLEYTIVYNPTEFISASIDAVMTTLFEAVVLVVLVIVLFLGSIRASLIPIVAIPVSLIGTFALMAMLGFSLNTLTLFGLVLAIGIVVDDAIIVVENVERYLRQGETPREAARKTMKEVSSALVANGLVMLAIFMPVAAIGGITGQFFQQFALTIAASTTISVLVSLTLSPALAALILSGHGEGRRRRGLTGILTWPFAMFFRLFNWCFGLLEAGYALLIRGLLRIMVVMLVVYGGLIVLGVTQFSRAPTGFIPAQDQGYLVTVIQLPAGSSLARTDRVAKRATEIILEHPAVRTGVAIVGLDGATFTNAPNAAAIFVPMKPFDWRTENGYSDLRVLGELQRELFQIKDAMIFLLQPPPVRGIGSGGGWKLYVQDRRGRGLEALEQATFGAMIQANGIEGLTQVFTLFNTKTPKVFADIDLVKAQLIGVSPAAINETLEVYLGSSFVNDFNFLGRTYRVTAQADGPFRDEIEDIARLRTRSESGGMVPIGSVATFEEQTGPYRVARYNLYPAAALQGRTEPGTSTGEAIERMEALLDAQLPSGFSYEWTELALQEKLAGSSAIYVFMLAIVFVFLLLAAQYESWLLPLSVILIVPMCLLAAISGVLYRGMDNNILTQIGLVVLVGLASKNAILIVEFARQAEEAGRSRVEAAVEAARLRLRPILMTSFAFILGVVPLVIATGPGAEMRQALGTAVFYGMIGVTTFGLIFTPIFYVLCRWIGALFRGELRRDNDEEEDMAAI
ncbi:multidrug efflux RND transporter permease subunit [Paralimibaculum aggregatum]|uniref:Efflux pump membrane transporter n=1 Tax=Paralimibaculum aggregatum TaxID=3036245 RepID=A0ABQ6LIG4_9RHOB|nr:multidrug efflux RND transporter permease subunit [Limibaculum sp. NKW23]GMG81939.1 multidrug efflux RND transporter permease subunit [Limibaculum sp. NKW23]